MARATPAECVIHTASAVQNPRSPGCSPSSGIPSGVNENSPLIPSATSASPSAGSSSAAAAHDSSKSAAVNARTAGSVPSLAGSSGIGRWPYAPTPSRVPCSRKYRSAP